MKKRLLKRKVCPGCAYIWKPRVSKPKECPRCKKRLDRHSPYCHLDNPQ